jgi:hypothetical protein
LDGHISEVLRAARFLDAPEDFLIEMLRVNIPKRWKNGQRDSVESVGGMLGDARDHKLYEKVGCVTWQDYCSTFLGVPSQAMDELIEGVRIIQRGSGPLEKISEEAARAAASQMAHEQRKQADENKTRGVHLPDIIRKVPNDGGTSASYRLRRLARDAPDILAAYERGEHASVAAAARAAGFARPQSMGKPQALAAKIVERGEDYAREVILEIEAALSRR